MIDISFKKDIESPKILSAIFEADSFFYGLIDSNNQLAEVKLIENVNLLDASSVQLNIPDFHYDKVILTNCGEKFMFFAEMPDIEEVKRYSLFENQKIFIDKLIDKNVYVVHGVDQLWYDQILMWFGSFEMIHFSSAISQNYYLKPGKIVHAHIFNNKLHIYCQESGNFKYYNVFTCHGDKDYLYYLIAANEELKMDFLSETLYLSGLVDQNSSIYSTIKSYVNNVIFYDSLPFKLLSNDYRHKPHLYFDILSSALCVL